MSSNFVSSFSKKKYILVFLTFSYIMELICPPIEQYTIQYNPEEFLTTNTVFFLWGGIIFFI